MSEINISPSKLEVYTSCSWKYYCQYILKIVGDSNDGARRGTVCHLVLECLINPRHRKHYDLLVKTKNVELCPALYRLIQKASKKERLDLTDNLQLINSMILVALKYDFFGYPEGGENNVSEIKTEGRFYLNLTESFKINGIIDKKIFYNDGSIKIKDYKSSKSKFSQEKLLFNYQALTYALSVYKTTGKIPEVEFIFLRFPKSPGQTVRLSEDDLIAFESYLITVAEQMSKFSEDDAVGDFAKNDKKRSWLCGKEDGWCCEYRKPMVNYRIKDSNNKIIRTSLHREELKPKSGEKIVKLTYKGCPAFNLDN